MDHPALVALSPLDGRYAGQCAALHPVFSEFGLMHRRVRVEIAWLLALAEHPDIPELPAFDTATRTALLAIGEQFSVDDAAAIKRIEHTTNHDVKAVEYFIKQRMGALPGAVAATEFVHFACTSEDINNLAYALMLKDARESVLLPALDGVITQLRAMAHAHADLAMLARTHGQPASPTTLGKEAANVVARLQRQRQQFAAVEIPGKINGAVGNFNAHVVAYPEVDWQQLAQGFVAGLGLHWNPWTTQIEPHDGIAEYCDAVRRANIVLLDLTRDLWGYIAMGYFKLALRAGEVGSSTMPHKVNPIDFENAEGNLGLANALLGHFSEKLPVSRFQRDLTDSTVLRALGTGFGHTLVALTALARGLGKLDADPARMATDLESAWEVLAEAVQTVMRRHSLPEPYEQLKALTRGRVITPAMLAAFIESLPLPESAKARLLALTPAAYTGLAGALARDV
jgi:adenylosuccinate lyase